MKRVSYSVVVKRGKRNYIVVSAYDQRKSSGHANRKTIDHPFKFTSYDQAAAFAESVDFDGHTNIVSGKLIINAALANKKARAAKQDKNKEPYSGHSKWGAIHTSQKTFNRWAKDGKLASIMSII